MFKNLIIKRVVIYVENYFNLYLGNYYYLGFDSKDRTCFKNRLLHRTIMKFNITDETPDVVIDEIFEDLGNQYEVEFLDEE